MTESSAFFRGYETPAFAAEIENVEAQANEGAPMHACLTLAVCAGLLTSCGWKGWMLEVATTTLPTAEKTIDRKTVVPSIGSQNCPRCGSLVYRTGHSREFIDTKRQWPR